MRSWRSWRWMQSANGYTFPKEIIIYNIYYIYYILLFIYYTYGFVSNTGKILTIRNLLHLCWGLHDLHDLMTSWPLDKTGGLQLRGTCNCSFSVPTNQPHTLRFGRGTAPQDEQITPYLQKIRGFICWIPIKVVFLQRKYILWYEWNRRKIHQGADGLRIQAHIGHSPQQGPADQLPE